ncbi:MAG: hypothetical protein ACI9XB_005328 [Gammaproteobacteria bacterium]|jgi:hypothetical protein
MKVIPTMKKSIVKFSKKVALDMTTIIAATNRAESNTIKVAKEVSLLLTNTTKKKLNY